MVSTNICERAGTHSPYTHPPPTTQTLPHLPHHTPTLPAHATHAAHATRRDYGTRAARREGLPRATPYMVAHAAKGLHRSRLRPSALLPSPTVRRLHLYCTRAKLVDFPCRYRHLKLFFSEVHFSCTDCLTLSTAPCKLISSTAATPQRPE